jgi:hypothetical protein
MVRKTILTTTLVGLAAASAPAQDARVELSGTAGWTFSDGVSGDGVTVPGVGSFDRIDPKDAFVKSDAAGWWCDPYWGCYVVSDAQYSNQLELSGGVTLRF